MNTNECSTCKHYKTEHPANPRGDCTLYPAWLDVPAAHYCGQWSAEEAPTSELDIDWSQVPEGYDWAAQDENGDIFAFDIEPISAVSLEWLSKTKNYYLVSHGEFYNPDWRNTLTKRPRATSTGK